MSFDWLAQSDNLTCPEASHVQAKSILAHDQSRGAGVRSCRGEVLTLTLVPHLARAHCHRPFSRLRRLGAQDTSKKSAVAENILPRNIAERHDTAEEILSSCRIVNKNSFGRRAITRKPKHGKNPVKRFRAY